jgi:hypothetical protein
MLLPGHAESSTSDLYSQADPLQDIDMDAKSRLNGVRGELVKRLSRAAKHALACAFFTACAHAQGFTWNSASDFSPVIGRSSSPSIEEVIDTFGAVRPQVSPASEFSVIKVLLRHGSEIAQTAFSPSASAQSASLIARKTDHTSVSPRCSSRATFWSRVKSGLCCTETLRFIR